MFVSGYCRLAMIFFFFSSRRRHTRCYRDWSSDVCSSDLHGYDALDVLRAVELRLKVVNELLLFFGQRGARVERARLHDEPPHDPVKRRADRAAGKRLAAVLRLQHAQPTRPDLCRAGPSTADRLPG